MSIVKVLALNEKGQLTFCTVPPEERGKGRCNHSLHQEDGESKENFVQRVNKESDYGDRFLKEAISGEVELKQYKMSDEEKINLLHVLGRKHLDMEIEGGYIELSEPLWNDMDKNAYNAETKTRIIDINGVLEGSKFIVTDMDDDVKERLKIDNIITKEKKDILEEKYNGKIKFDTGVIAMNTLASKIGFEATNSIYVLPYYMRQNPPDGTSKNPINTLYNLLIVKRKDPNVQQQAYESLLNNSQAQAPRTVRGGYAMDSLAERFKGKSGIMRANMSGRRIVNSGRALITPDINMEYGSAKIPASMAAKIFEPTIRDRLKQDGNNPKEIEEFIGRFKGVDQEDISKDDRLKLEEIMDISGVKIVLNRQPSLHFSSLLSFKPKISPDVTVKMNPLNLPGYNADFDGDTSSIFGINDSFIGNIAKDMDPSEKYGTHMPRARKELIAKPTKESLWGLYNILSKRS